MSNESEESLESKKLRLEIAALEAAALHTAATQVLELEQKKLELEQKKRDLEEKELNVGKLRDEETERKAREEHLVYRFTQAVYPPAVSNCIKKLDLWSGVHPGAPLEVVFTSPGGSVYHGMSLFDHLRMLSRKGHHITTGAEGYAASMAGILLQAGDTRWVGQESWTLIHEVSSYAWGKASEMEDTVEHMKRLQERVIKIFLGRAAAAHAEDLLTETQFKNRWRKTDWWLSSEEMRRHGFVDEVR